MRTALNPDSLRRIYDRLARRYDVQHALITAGADGRGRRMLVRAAVRAGDSVLDAGGGTGSTALLAARAVGPNGRVTVLDQSEGMLAVARKRMRAEGLADRTSFHVGDINQPPFPPNTFDVVLSTYSMCPLTDPSEGAEALYALVRPGGVFGAAHSAEPRGRVVRWVAERVEDLAWRIPALSMGCRAVSVLPHLRSVGARVELDRHIGVPLWPFDVFVVRKPS